MDNRTKRENQIVEDIIFVAKKLGLQTGNKIGRSDYYNNGANFSHYDIYDNGRSWKYYCKKAGYIDKTIKQVSDDVYFANLKRAVSELGRFPKVSERKAYCLNFRKSRWATLDAFICEAIDKGIVDRLDYKVHHKIDDIVNIGETKSTDQVNKQSRSAIDVTSPIPSQTKRKRWERISIACFPYAPQDEQGVVAIFSILCFCKLLNYQIIDLNGGKGHDADCFDLENQQIVKIEFKYNLAKHSFNHSLDSFDIIVCWINKWENIGKKVIELKSFLSNIHI